ARQPRFAYLCAPFLRVRRRFRDGALAAIGGRGLLRAGFSGEGVFHQQLKFALTGQNGMSGIQKRELICCWVAYDTIMVFPDRFRTHILPDKLHMLNVAFLVPQMRREFVGSAASIAYTLKLHGDVGYRMGGIGSDFQPYREWMKKVGLSEKYLVT